MFVSTNLRLRALELSDVELLFSLENNPDMVYYSGNGLAPLSMFQIRSFVESNTGDLYADRQLRLVVEYFDGVIKEPIGLIDAFEFEPYHSRIGIGIVVFPEFRGRGFAKKSVLYFTNYLFEFWGIHSVWALVDFENIASKKLFEDVGFKQVGQKRDWFKIAGRYTDVVEYQLVSSL